MSPDAPVLHQTDKARLMQTESYSTHGTHTTTIDPRDQASVNAILLERTERFEHALFGNGQPGVLADVAALKSASTKTTAKSGGLSAIVAVAVAVVMHKLGVA